MWVVALVKYVVVLLSTQQMCAVIVHGTQYSAYRSNPLVDLLLGIYIQAC